MPITLPPDLLLFGNATPESNRQARIGSLFQRLDSGTFPLYVKTTTGAKTGWRPVMVAPATGGFTAGSVVFAGSGGQLAQDNANLFWDDTNNRLGIGTASPGEPLHVVGDARITEGLSVGSGASPVGQNGRIYLRGNSTGTIEVSDGSGTYGQLVLLTNNIAGWVDTGSGLAQKLWLNNTGLGIGVSPTYALDVLGSTNFVGTAKISSWFGQDKTNYRGVFLGYDTSGQIGIIAADTASAASSLAFWTYSGSAWAERVRIDSTGLGIGLSPVSILETGSPTATYWNQTTAGTWNGSVTPPQALTITNSYPGGYDPILLFRQATSTGVLKTTGAISFIGTSSWTNGTDSTQISDMVFISRNTVATLVERMRITSSGQVGIATASPGAGYELDVNGDFHYTTSTASSDRRFKKNIQQLTGVVAKLRQIRGVSFEWNEAINSKRSGYKLGQTVYGVIAQEVQPHFPELVKVSDIGGFDKALGVSYDRFIPILIEAVKELDNRLAKLES